MKWDEVYAEIVAFSFPRSYLTHRKIESSHQPKICWPLGKVLRVCSRDRGDMQGEKLYFLSPFPLNTLLTWKVVSEFFIITSATT